MQISLDEEGAAYSNFFAFPDYRSADDYASAKFFWQSKASSYSSLL